MTKQCCDNDECIGLRYAGVIWILFLIGPLDLVGMWFCEDERANTMKTHVQ